MIKNAIAKYLVMVGKAEEVSGLKFIAFAVCDFKVYWPEAAVTPCIVLRMCIPARVLIEVHFLKVSKTIAGK